MKKIGVYLIIAGAGSILLNQFGYEFQWLLWVDNWGPAVGWGIRAGAIVVGVILFVIGVQQDQKPSALENSEAS